jgi:hypothetical protein
MECMHSIKSLLSFSIVRSLICLSVFPCMSRIKCLSGDLCPLSGGFFMWTAEAHTKALTRANGDSLEFVQRKKSLSPSLSLSLPA